MYTRHRFSRAQVPNVNPMYQHETKSKVASSDDLNLLLRLLSDRGTDG